MTGLLYAVAFGFTLLPRMSWLGEKVLSMTKQRLRALVLLPWIALLVAPAVYVTR